MNYQRIDTNEPYPPDTIFLSGCDDDGHWEVNYVRQQESEGVVVEIVDTIYPYSSQRITPKVEPGTYRLTRIGREE